MRRVGPALLLLVASLVPIVAAAQTPPAPDTPPPPPPRWERQAELSLVATGGNTDTQTLGAGASLVWRPAPWTTEAKVGFVRSKADEVLTAESFAADFRQARSMTDRVDAFGRFGYL